jgi:hypothetical protein
MTHLLFTPYQKLGQIFAWLASCYSAFHKNVALKKSSIFSQGLPQHNIAGPTSKLHSLFASLHDCHIVIIDIRRLNNNIQVFSSGMMFLVLLKTDQVFQKLKLGDRYDDLKRPTFSFLGRKVGQIW